MYAILVGVTLAIFFVSMWSVHSAIAGVKRKELELARKRLAAASVELKDRAEQDPAAGMEGLTTSITSWATYQRLVKEIPTWPFTAGIIRRLLASIIAPAIVYLIKILSGMGFRL